MHLVAINIDGQRFGDHHVISGAGVDRAGDKHVLGIEIGAIENGAAAKKRLVSLRERGFRTDQQYLFVIDGAKALRASIEGVFGGEQPVQRCRNHKMRNVMDELPRDQHAQVRDVMRAAWKLTRRRRRHQETGRLSAVSRARIRIGGAACARGCRRCPRFKS